MSGDGTTGANRRLDRRTVTSLGVALVIGVAIGIAVNVASPNPVYGWQLIADGLAILICLAVLAIPAARSLRPASVGLAVGVIAGVAIGMNLVSKPSDVQFTGSVHLRLGAPEILDMESPAICRVDDGLLAYVVAGTEPATGTIQLANGRSVGLVLESRPAPAGRPLDIVVTIRTTLADGTVSELRMTSDASSTISISHAGETGSMAFGGLVLHPESAVREPMDVAGTVTWDCRRT